MAPAPIGASGETLIADHLPFFPGSQAPAWEPDLAPKLLLCLEGLKRTNISDAKQSLAPIGVPRPEL
jgi:hypothetical protein